MTRQVVDDRVRVYFTDGSSTLTYVLADDSIQDHIVELCECKGCDLSTVDGFRIEGQVMADDY